MDRKKFEGFMMHSDNLLLAQDHKKNILAIINSHFDVAEYLVYSYSMFTIVPVKPDRLDAMSRTEDYCYACGNFYHGVTAYFRK